MLWKRATSRGCHCLSQVSSHQREIVLMRRLISSGSAPWVLNCMAKNGTYNFITLVIIDSVQTHEYSQDNNTIMPKRSEILLFIMKKFFPMEWKPIKCTRHYTVDAKCTATNAVFFSTLIPFNRFTPVSIASSRIFMEWEKIFSSLIVSGRK